MKGRSRRPRIDTSKTPCYTGNGNTHFPPSSPPPPPPPPPPSFPFPHSIDFKIKSLPLEDKKLKLQIWDTAGQERFRTITTAYYRGAMGILLVYDVTDERSFANVKTWMKQIEQHASENVNRVLIGNKCDAAPGDRRVTLEQGKKLAEEYGIKFFETSSKNDINVDEAFMTIARDIVQRYVTRVGWGGSQWCIRGKKEERRHSENEREAVTKDSHSPLSNARQDRQRRGRCWGEGRQDRRECREPCGRQGVLQVIISQLEEEGVAGRERNCVE